MTTDQQTSSMGNGQAEFFARCADEVGTWNEADRLELERFVNSPVGRKMFGIFELRIRREFGAFLIIQSAHASASHALALHQGIIKGLIVAQQEMLESSQPPKDMSDDNE